jgi:type VI secretion system secreted protein VgrG
MEEEGIFYFFKHEKGKHTLIFADKPAAHTDCVSNGSVEYRPSTHTTKQEEDVVFRAQLEEQITSNQFTVGDYNFETPSTQLTSTAKGQKGKLEVREWPSVFEKKADAEAVARRRIEERELPMKELRGASHCRGFTTGNVFAMKKHPRADMNGKWVLNWMHHQADINQYRNEFRAFPKDTPFRPMRTTRKPVIVGTQTALVVGKKGEEIFTDKFGRVKVQFHWDRLGKKDEKSSCWVRVAQGWAGKKWGGLFIPRIGMEVIVSFTDGDPDRPLVTGAVYNAENTLPYDLPAKATQSTLKSNSSKGGGGFNEIRFEDKKGKEEFWMHAQKDMKVKILHDLFRETLHDEKITIKNSRTVTIKESDDSLTVTKGNRKIEVSKGNEIHSVKGTRTLTVTKDETHKNEKNFIHKVKKDYTLTVDGDLKITVKGDIIINGKKDIKFDAGMNLLTKAKMNAKHEALAIDFKAKTKFGVKALQVEVAATMIKMKADAMMKLESGALFDAKGGAMAKVEGGGMLMLKGGLAKIN